LPTRIFNSDSAVFIDAVYRIGRKGRIGEMSGSGDN
jgi:hypothetical protein